jgi:LPXTG-site transpeptidase (sortase) family protein
MRSGRVNIRQSFKRVIQFILVILLVTGVISLPSLVSSAQLGNYALLPIIFNNSGIGLTETITPSPTLTGTAGPSPTQTLTPSPTFTGTLVPNAVITIAVTGSPANVNQNLVFTIKVSNIGTGPTFNNIVADSFPTYLDVLTVTTTAGSYNKLTHSFVASVGTVNPGAVITIVATVRVNSSLTRTETATNTAVLTYNEVLSKSAGVSYRVIYQTLPPTGELPLNWREAAVQPLSILPGIMLMLIGGILLILAVGSQKVRSSNYKLWLTVGGALLFVTGFIAAVTTSGIFRPNLQSNSFLATATEPGSMALALPSATSQTRQPAWEFSTPDNAVPIVTLPDYPVPTPAMTITPQPGESGPDTSEINRIVIPILNLDTVVKYVPFDGVTWAIAGLRQEVAWMGDTSWPGLGGNTGLAGHVTVAGMGDGPFRHLDELPVGELVLLYTDENIYTYRVRETKITDDGDMSVTEQTINSEISLITCVDWDEQNHTYLNRLIVIADLIDTQPQAIGKAP